MTDCSVCAGLCGAGTPLPRCGCAPSCPRVWTTAGPTASASCYARTTTCTPPASARPVSAQGGAGEGHPACPVGGVGSLNCGWVWREREGGARVRPPSLAGALGLTREPQQKRPLNLAAAFCALPPCALPTRRLAGLGLHGQRGCAHLRIPAAVHTTALPEQPHVFATHGPGHS